MKKFFAALLSALVGVFGYTLTDTAVEERISKLETEIVELHREVSSNNQLNGNVSSIEIGDYIKISPTSFDKFLLRENEEGKLEYIHPVDVEEIYEDDIFVYLTDATCQATDFEVFTRNYEFGINYDSDSWEIKMPVLSVSCSGYTSPSLSGKQLTFVTGVGETVAIIQVPTNSFDTSKTTCVVSSDGSFDFSCDISLKDIAMAGDIINNFELLDLVYYMYGKEYIESNAIYTEDFFGPGFGVYKVTIS